jgi:beta-lactamase class A
MLQDLVGSGNINKSMASLGLSSTKFLPEGLSTTAADVALLLEGIGRRQLVSQPASERMTYLMAQERFDNGLRAGVPAGAAVAHKTGNWQGVTHDAGIVFGPKANYLVVVLSSRENAPALIKAISEATFDYYK